MSLRGMVPGYHLRRRTASRGVAAACVLVTAAMLTGCAGLVSIERPSGPLPQVELTDVPFFPQTDYQCGPAALATILSHQNVAVTADDLVPAVYVEGLRGSLQAELMGATRRHGLVPYQLEPDIDSLLAEVASGRPVLVLQNLGLRSRPVWHYAVVIGFEPENDRVILRSGEEHRRMERTRRFLRSWALADNWAFVAARPGELPVSSEPRPYIRALADAEALLHPLRATQAYTAALARWPNDAVVAFAAANQQYAHGHLEQAANLYRVAAGLDPDHAAARNNLAHVLAAQGCAAAALAEARLALAATETGDPLYNAIRDTVTRLEASSHDATDSTCL
jgi:hypothetical protein